MSWGFVVLVHTVNLEAGIQTMSAAAVTAGKHLSLNQSLADFKHVFKVNAFEWLHSFHSNTQIEPLNR